MGDNIDAAEVLLQRCQLLFPRALVSVTFEVCFLPNYLILWHISPVFEDGKIYEIFLEILKKMYIIHNTSYVIYVNITTSKEKDYGRKEDFNDSLYN